MELQLTELSFIHFELKLTRLRLLEQQQFICLEFQVTMEDKVTVTQKPVGNESVYGRQKGITKL